MMFIIIIQFNSKWDENKLNSNQMEDQIDTALESSEGTQIIKKQRWRQSSGRTWIVFEFKLLLLHPQTHPGATK